VAPRHESFYFSAETAMQGNPARDPSAAGCGDSAESPPLKNHAALLWGSLTVEEKGRLQADGLLFAVLRWLQNHPGRGPRPFLSRVVEDFEECPREITERFRAVLGRTWRALFTRALLRKAHAKRSAGTKAWIVASSLGFAFRRSLRRLVLRDAWRALAAPLAAG
jgi:hypothetical protein